MPLCAGARDLPVLRVLVSDTGGVASGFARTPRAWRHVRARCTRVPSRARCALILVGSRGGQVVLPVLLRGFWRGPVVAIHAGPLTSNSAIPVGSDPWFVTCGQD